MLNKEVSDKLIVSAMGAVPVIEKIALNATSRPDENGYKYVAVKCAAPSVSAWGTDGYWTDGTSVKETLVELTERKNVSLKIDEREYAEDNLEPVVMNWAKAAGRKLGNDIAAKFCDVLDAVTPLDVFSLGDAGAKVADLSVADLANLAAKVKSFTVDEVEYQMDPAECALVLNHTAYAAILAKLQANVVANGAAVASGLIGDLLGFSGIYSMGVTGPNVCDEFCGWVVPMGAICGAARIIKPLDSVVECVTDQSATGFPFSIRTTYDQQHGVRYTTAETIYGFKASYDADENPNAPRCIAVQMTAAA